jgi:succinate dehydrogenase / fumarate reductase cytochrome b subunit
MKWFLDLFSSSLGRKLMMALTGLFLITFLAVHLAGNLQLLNGDDGVSFNKYAEFMSTNPLIQVVSKLNFAFIIIHALWALMLSRKNAAARGSVGYAVASGKSSHWTSRNMGILGTVLLVFIIIHLKDFWAEMHFGDMKEVVYDGQNYRNIYSLVNEWFHKEWYVALYVASMAAVGFHLYHGFASAFQTLGLNHLKYNKVIEVVGKSFAVIVSVLFAIIPVIMYFN